MRSREPVVSTAGKISTHADAGMLLTLDLAAGPRRECRASDLRGGGLGVRESDLARSSRRAVRWSYSP